MNSKSGLLEFLVYFSPSLGELVDRNSKFVLLEFLVFFSPSLCWLLVSCAAVLLVEGEFVMVDLNPGLLELMVFSTGVVLVILFSFNIVILCFLPFLVLNFDFLFRALITLRNKIKKKMLSGIFHLIPLY